MKSPSFSFVRELPSDAASLRQEVFTLEQGFKEEEDIDSYDPISTHLLCYLDDVLIGTLRFYEESIGVFHLGRFVIKKEYRHLGLGSRCIQEALAYIKGLGGKKVRLGAQYDKTGFYARNGFILESKKTFLDGGYPHLWMALDL